MIRYAFICFFFGCCASFAYGEYQDWRTRKDERAGLLQENAYIRGWEQGRFDAYAEMVAQAGRLE